MDLIIALVIATAAFLGGWTTNGWRMGEKLQALTADHNNAVADAAEASNRRLITLVNERDAKASRLATIDREATQQLTKERHENQILSARLAAGSVGLRIAATCATQPAAGSGAAQGGGVDPAAGAVLDAVARRAYSALRDGITTTEKTLSACQRSLAELER